MSKTFTEKRYDAEAIKALEMRDSGMPLRDIADRLHWSYSKVGRRIARGEKLRAGTIKELTSEVAELRAIVYAMRIDLAQLKRGAA